MADINTWASQLVGEVGGALSGMSSKLDAGLMGLSWKNAARAAAATNITRTAPGAVIGGVAMSVDDRALLKGQTIQSDNGIYLWKGASLPLVRAPDADTPDELASAAVLVSEGSLAGTMWVQSTPVAAFGGQLGGAPVVWVQTGAGSSVTPSTYTLTIE